MMVRVQLEQLTHDDDDEVQHDRSALYQQMSTTQEEEQIEEIARKWRTAS